MTKKKMEFVKVKNTSRKKLLRDDIFVPPQGNFVGKVLAETETMAKVQWQPFDAESFSEKLMPEKPVTYEKKDLTPVFGNRQDFVNPIVNKKNALPRSIRQLVVLAALKKALDEICEVSVSVNNIRDAYLKILHIVRIRNTGNKNVHLKELELITKDLRYLYFDGYIDMSPRPFDAQTKGAGGFEFRYSMTKKGIVMNRLVNIESSGSGAMLVQHAQDVIANSWIWSEPRWEEIRKHFTEKDRTILKMHGIELRMHGDTDEDYEGWVDTNEQDSEEYW